MNLTTPAPANHSMSQTHTQTTAKVDLDAAAVKLAAQAAFLQAFAEGLVETERPVEELLPQRPKGEIDFGWRAGLR